MSDLSQLIRVPKGVAHEKVFVICELMSVLCEHPDFDTILKPKLEEVGAFLHKVREAELKAPIHPDVFIDKEQVLEQIRLAQSRTEKAECDEDEEGEQRYAASRPWEHN